MTTTPQSMSDDELPVPAFRLTWRGGAYYVSEPSIGNTDCYTAEQLHAVRAQAFHDGQVAGRATAEQAGKVEVCQTCNGHGMIGGFVNAQSGYQDEPCPDCAKPTQPAATDLPGMWEASDFTGGDPDERCHSERGLHPATADLVARFAAAISAKLYEAERKYGWGTHWQSPAWMDQCREQLVEHVAKGDPRDVAAYCAFLWHHGESTATQPAAPSVVSHELEATAVVSHEQAVGEKLPSPKWYTRDEIISALRLMNYSDLIAHELADWFVRHLQHAFDKGHQIGQRDSRAAAPIPPSREVEALYTADEVAEAMEILRGRHGSTALMPEVLDAMAAALLAPVQEK